MLIGITGQKFSGKDTFAGQLIRNYSFQERRFAYPLKEMLRAMYRAAGLPEAEIERRIEGDLKEEPCDLLAGRTPRHAMQTLGTEWRNMIAPDLWIRQWEHRIRFSHNQNIVVPDVRFQAEAEAIRRHHGIIVRVVRPMNGSNDFSRHISETEMTGIQVDATVYNDGTIEDLWAKADKLYRSVSV